MTEREYNECVTIYADNVYRFILKNLRHEEDAKDVVQTAFEKMWRNREEVDAQKSKSYLFTVAYHQMIDHIRKVKRIQLKEEFSETSKIDAKPPSNVRATSSGRRRRRDTSTSSGTTRRRAAPSRPSRTARVLHLAGRAGHSEPPARA